MASLLGYLFAEINERACPENENQIERKVHRNQIILVELFLET